MGDEGARRAEARRRDAALPDRDWSELPNGVTRSWHSAPSGRLAMISAGDPAAPRVVLVPGVTGSKEDFILMMPLLADAGYRVESFDMAGQYESAEAGPENVTPPRRSYDHDLFVDDLISVLEAGPGPAHLLGYSFAGTVSQLATVRRPELVASLTLLSCPPESGQGFRGVKRLGPFTGLATGRVGAALMIWGVRRNFTKVPPGRLAFVRHRFGFTRRQSVRDIISLMKRAPDAVAELASSGLPMLIAVGEHDLWPTSLHRAFADSLGARLVIYPTGHSPCETTPYELVLDLLTLYNER
ncbi:alpha/beta hydrolase [Antiquaquibacter oligotrophicus]|nr:alpha/beta hydrolase [Antiquaquibacter oligotrophicus]UDF14659.1 alpha/beta hydrolase [Antiquaquibacter oligotrophicus]